MCGIVGAFRTGSSSVTLTPLLLETMRDTLVHRGPDAKGLFISPYHDVGLAFRRLSIIDLSENASQPMTNHDQSICLVFNGEIYNHAELRVELQGHGVSFKTDHSDTEVILRGYEQWGEGVLHRLRGMFAFAIWDQKKKTLWIARDRMGVKPLYYTFVAGYFLFASEIKAILEWPGLQRRMNPTAFYDFLTFLVSPAPHTLFEGIHKLPASHTLTVSADGTSSLKRYWNPFFQLAQFPTFSEDEWVEKIISTLRESVRYRMVSDVNFGVFLSGGIDSSTNLALMAEQMDRPVNSYSIGFESSEKFNELHYARIAAERFKARHHEVVITQGDLMRFLPQLIFHQDEPIVDPVCVPVYYVAKLAKDTGTTVCQVGEGADELFCGYPYWGTMVSAHQWVHHVRRLPAFLQKAMWPVANAFWPSPHKGLRQLELIRRTLSGQPFFWGGAEAYQETVKTRILDRSFLKQLDGYTSFEPIKQLWTDFQNDAPAGADPLHWMAYLDLRLRLPELLLMRVDKMTMATSVEARVPFLDQELVRLAMSIPASLKYKNKTLKYLLKKAVRPLLPAALIDRPKQGFGVPVVEWFQSRSGEWAAQKIAAFARRTPYFSPEALSSYLAATGSKMAWPLLNFVLWHEKWIEGRDLDLPSV